MLCPEIETPATGFSCGWSGRLNWTEKCIPPYALEKGLFFLFLFTNVSMSMCVCVRVCMHACVHVWRFFKHFQVNTFETDVSPWWVNKGVNCSKERENFKTFNKSGYHFYLIRSLWSVQTVIHSLSEGQHLGIFFSLWLVPDRQLSRVLSLWLVDENSYLACR